MKCEKEPKNPFDSEAIRVALKHIGTVGYVANSPYTGATGTMSAGRTGKKARIADALLTVTMSLHLMDYVEILVHELKKRKR